MKGLKNMVKRISCTSEKKFCCKGYSTIGRFLNYHFNCGCNCFCLLGEVSDSIVILAIAVINALLGIYQEGKAEKSVEALQKMSAPNAKVFREGRQSKCRQLMWCLVI